MTKNDLQQISQLMDLKFVPLLQAIQAADIKIDQKTGILTKKVDVLAQKIENVNQKVDNVDWKVTHLAGRLETVEMKLNQLQEDTTHILSGLLEGEDSLAHRVERIENHLGFGQSS